MTPRQRHACMAAIRGKDTKPEMVVRRYLHALGYRYGLHNRRLPGTPDIVLRKLKTVIFINGCFWHGHPGCRYYRLPSTNPGYWQKKIETNHERDARAIQELNRMKWTVIVIWECELKPREAREKRLARLDRTLREIAADNYRFYHYPDAETESLAAEPDAGYGYEE